MHDVLLVPNGSRQWNGITFGLWMTLITSLVVSAVIWIAEHRLHNDTIVTSRTMDGVTINGQPAGVWVDRHPRHERLWEILLASWFYPAKILIQSGIANRGRQTLCYGGLLAAATVWVWAHLVTWDWWMCETIYSKVIGTPLMYLFVPSVFFISDLWRDGPRPLGMLVWRIPIELLLVVPWIFIWAFLQLLLGWLWI